MELAVLGLGNTEENAELRVGRRPRVVSAGIRDEADERSVPSSHEAAAQVSGGVADEQIRCLVRQLFFADSGHPARHVVFSAVDEGTDVAGICMLAGQTLAAQVQAAVGVAEASPLAFNSQNRGETRNAWPQEKPRAMRSPVSQVSHNLWVVSRELFWGTTAGSGSSTWARDRFNQLRSEFDCAIVHAPAIASYSEAIVLGQTGDGLVLVVEANLTRRIAAQKAKELLHLANVCLLGVVLSGRTFPIPERIYRRI